MRKVSAKQQTHLAKKAAKGQNRWSEPRHKRWERYVGLARKYPSLIKFMLTEFNSCNMKVPTDAELIAMQSDEELANHED